MEMINNSANRYGLIASLLHWIMAIIIIGLIILGLYMVTLPIGLKKLKLYGWHKELGILILMLVFFRLFWRIINITPQLPQEMPEWQAFAAHAVHYLFYLLMIAMPISGWMLSSAAGLPVSFFGWFLLPDLVQPDENLRKLLITIHEWLGYSFIAFIGAHMGAALFHHFIDKNDILQRMLPWDSNR